MTKFIKCGKLLIIKSGGLMLIENNVAVKSEIEIMREKVKEI